MGLGKVLWLLGARFPLLLCVLHWMSARDGVGVAASWGRDASFPISVGLGVRDGELLNRGRSHRDWRSLQLICPKSTFLEHSAAVGEWI